MSEGKSFWDYTPQRPPDGWMCSYTGTVLACLKLFGGVQGIQWRFIVALWVGGFIYTVGHTAIRQAKAENQKSPTLNSTTGRGDGLW